MLWSRLAPMIAGTAILSATVAAQQMELRFPAPAERAPVRAPWRADSGQADPGIRAPRVPAIPRRDSSWWVPLASTVLPGSGQALLGQDRFVAYLAVEGFVILNYLKVNAEESRERGRSRSLARDVARAAFGGARPIGEWPYYESMEKFIESGVFNRLPGSELAPEADAETFNGWLWLDVRQRYWTNPSVEPAHASAAYRSAINEYIARAVRDDMRWTWRNAQLEQDLFRRSIRRKNSAAHSATSFLNLMLINRLLSTVDAFVTIRLHGGAGMTGETGAVSATVPWAPLGRPSQP